MVDKDISSFIDTNILLRFNIAEAPEHPQVRSAIQVLIDNGNQLWISRQVVREFASVITRPQTFKKPLSSKEAAARIRLLLSTFSVAEENDAVAHLLLELMEEYPMGGKQIYDANIAATMLMSGITHLFTLNLTDFERFENRITLVTLENIVGGSSMSNEIVHRETIADGKIICYRFQSLGTEAADEWFEDITDLFEQWDDAELLLILLDLRAAESNLLSPEGMLRARQVSAVDQNGKTALIIDSEKPANNLIMFLEKALKSTRPREVFTTEADAVAWLLAE